MFDTGTPFADKLLGHCVTRLAVGPEEATLFMEREDGAVVEFRTSGDCCSESWWADAVGVKQLLGAKIRRMGWIEMPDPEDDRSRQEVDEAYGLRIETSRGVCELVFRNSSNGYYGGWADVDWINQIPDSARDITQDWRA